MLTVAQYNFERERPANRGSALIHPIEGGGGEQSTVGTGMGRGQRRRTTDYTDNGPKPDLHTEVHRARLHKIEFPKESGYLIYRSYLLIRDKFIRYIFRLSDS